MSWLDWLFKPNTPKLVFDFISDEDVSVHFTWSKNFDYKKYAELFAHIIHNFAHDEILRISLNALVKKCQEEDILKFANLVVSRIEELRGIVPEQESFDDIQIDPLNIITKSK